MSETQVKRETSLAKVRRKTGRLKATESTGPWQGQRRWRRHPNPQPLGRSVAKGCTYSERRLIACLFPWSIATVNR